MPKYDKKFRVTVVDTETRRTVHENVDGKICYPAYFKVGERGWFLCEMSEILFPTPVHRIETSTVRDIQYSTNGLTVYTANTEYKFEEVNNDDAE